MPRAATMMDNQDDIPPLEPDKPDVKFGFLTVVLRTPDGRHVAEIECPAFEVMPGVVGWGGRVFVHRGGMKPNEYREDICWWADPSLSQST